ncbi:Hypothetical predicted protein [Mytilus galloprovincialis]|uniref:DNA-directed RNA polymerase n=1 Tax=Mytilus galloprovincialis TaxID=29158 RepID=A0A8B6H2T9_MYTGA|nr:Hypothetical predicted protein [Mytilus galloprovincialis]
MEFTAPSPYEAITGRDVFLDGTLLFPVTATTIGQGTPSKSSQLTNVFTSVTTKTGQHTINAGSVGYHEGVPTITTVTHTFARPFDTTGSISSYPGSFMGLNLPGSRAPASYCGFTLPATASNAMSRSNPLGFPCQRFHGQGFLSQGFPNQVFPSQVLGQPFPGVWPYCGPITTPVIVPQSTTSNLSVPAPPLAVSSSSCTSVSVTAALPSSSVRHQFNQVRTTGPIDQVTHQPVKGRKRGGGIRFGEMERDALISHGSAFLLQDRLLNCSDSSLAHVCKKCGSILSPYMDRPPSANAAVSAEQERKWSCSICKQTNSIELIKVPYVFKYLVAELAAINIKVNLDIQAF